MKPASGVGDSCPKCIEVACVVAAIAWSLVGRAVLDAQAPASNQAQQRSAMVAAAAAEPSGQTATLVFFNRRIVTFRARVLGRNPIDRTDAAAHVLDGLAARGIAGPVEWQSFDAGALVRVAGRVVLVLTRPDVDELNGQSIEALAADTVAQLTLALAEAHEAHSARAMIRAGIEAAVGLVAGALAIWGLARARRAAATKLIALGERTIARGELAKLEILRVSRLVQLESGLVSAVALSVQLVVVFATAAFVLRRFPYTRPWGESMRAFLIGSVEQLGLGIAGAVPGLFIVALILVCARIVVRLIGAWFAAIESGRLVSRWIYPETAQPTRRLLTGVIWVFAAVAAYPYLPGSGSDAFKGVSVFLGLIVTFGSSGLVNHILSGFIITFSRAVRAGDFVRIANVEGTVVHLGVLSVKIRTVRREEITIPNAVAVAQTATNYSRLAESDGVLTPTSVTIGYSTPWRQVHALLIRAAERTPGVRGQPPPIVLQAALGDFSVKYTLLVCLERQESRATTLNALHAQIQDLFNEYGVQIMSPHYVVDPAAPKVVAKTEWFAAPAPSDRQRSAS